MSWERLRVIIGHTLSHSWKKYCLCEAYWVLSLFALCNESIHAIFRDLFCVNGLLA